MVEEGRRKIRRKEQGREGKGQGDKPIIISIQMHRPKIHILQPQKCIEILTREAIILVIIPIGVGAMVEETDAACCDEVRGIEGFDEGGEGVGPGCERAGGAVGGLATGLWYTSYQYTYMNSADDEV